MWVFILCWFKLTFGYACSEELVLRSYPLYLPVCNNVFIQPGVPRSLYIAALVCQPDSTGSQWHFQTLSILLCSMGLTFSTCYSHVLYLSPTPTLFCTVHPFILAVNRKYYLRGCHHWLTGIDHVITISIRKNTSRKLALHSSVVCKGILSWVANV